MRLREFASAEDQIALWRLISNTVWTSIEQQRMQQQQAAPTAVLGKAAANLPARRVKAVRRKPAARKPSAPPVVSPTAKPAADSEKASKTAAAPQENKQADKQPSRQQSQQLSNPPATLPYIYQSNQPNQVVSANPSAAVGAKPAAVERKSAPAAVPDKRKPRTATQATAVDTVRQR
jgi:hypothetical protein